LGGPTRNGTAILPIGQSEPDFRLWSPQRISAYQASLADGSFTPIAVLRIASVSLEVPVLEGTDEVALNQGVGHIEGTSAPGAGGNVGIAGHRDGFFRSLKDIQQGDTIELISHLRNDRYVVDETLIVSPEHVSVLRARGLPSLTLVTCYPFYFVGSAPKRFVVHASLVESVSYEKSTQQSSSLEKGGGSENR
jgi:sortase A